MRSAEAMADWLDRDPRIRYYRNEQNVGHIASANIAYRMTSAEYVLQMHVDDVLHPDFLTEVLANGLARHPECAFGYSLFYRLINGVAVEGTHQYRPNLPTGVQQVGQGLQHHLGAVHRERRDQHVAAIAPGRVQDAAQFAQRVQEGRARLTLIAQEVARLAATILTEYASAQRKIKDTKNAQEATEDAGKQLHNLMPKDFIARTPWAQLQHFARYLKAITIRLDKVRADPARDAAKLKELQPLQQRYTRLLAQRKGQHDARLQEYRWMLEELRVSFFAQELRTPYPVSAKRLDKVWFYEVRNDGYDPDKIAGGGRVETPEKNEIPDLLVQWKAYKASGFATPPGLEANTLLPHGTVEPTCWWATREKLLDADYNLGAGQWKPRVAEKSSNEDPRELVAEVLDDYRKVVAGLESLLLELPQ